MKKKDNKKQEVVEELPVEKLDKSVISSEEVGEVISGDEVALAEQMERTKALTKEQQLEAMNNKEKLAAEQKAKEQARIEEEKRIQEEARKRLEANRLREEAKATELKAQEEAKKATEAKAQEEARKAAEAKAQEEARKAAEAKAQEEAKKVAENQTPTVKQNENNNEGPSTFKRVMAGLLFLVFFAIVWFLPEISNIISKYQNSRRAKLAIMDGVSICKSSRTSENLDINTTAKFWIINGKMYKLEYITTTVGDRTEDENELKTLNENCERLKLEAGELEGVSISCSLNNGTNTTREKLDYEILKVKEVKAAFVESGGIYPEFKKNESIDKIESKMRSSGYECSRQ